MDRNNCRQVLRAVIDFYACIRSIFSLVNWEFFFFEGAKMIQTCLWKQVRVYEKATSTKTVGNEVKVTKRVRVGWADENGAGEHMFFGDEMYNAVEKGDVIDVTGRQTDRGFVEVISVTGGSIGGQTASGFSDLASDAVSDIAGTESAGPSRRRKTAAA